MASGDQGRTIRYNYGHHRWFSPRQCLIFYLVVLLLFFGLLGVGVVYALLQLLRLLDSYVTKARGYVTDALGIDADADGKTIAREIYRAVDAYLRHFSADDYQAIGSVGAALILLVTLLMTMAEQRKRRDSAVIVPPSPSAAPGGRDPDATPPRDDAADS